ncbi:glycosyltransferase family 2 protein [Opitutus terrae]|uniref:Glycosyl transferase family 2 n=1 Tax=Opitutus terrae (strain DSM 11246 / JCM 15787 / PB90-1) TaxID=452637 RepID=B1ZVX0_OPITP|nr:glycosyltransferase family 2 protein [Opitutus terrae]ACB75056.1 glycosyl transferase family 2 [Opitutus terrae PB90-1]
MSCAAPTISIIVVTKNPGPRLVATLESIWGQRWVQPEIIIIDGGSTDGTLDWLGGQPAQIAVLVSENDRGVYDAMNKGVALAQGDWVLFLGADDRLVGDMTLSEMRDYLTRTEAGVVAGEVAFDDGRIYRLSMRRSPLVRNFVHHQGAFYRRTLFTEMGKFDTSLAIMGDYDFNLRLWKSGVTFKAVDLRVAACGTHGLSDSGHWHGYREEILVRHRYAAVARCWFWDLLSLVRFVRKKVLRTLPHAPPKWQQATHAPRRSPKP